MIITGPKGRVIIARCKSRWHIVVTIHPPLRYCCANVRMISWHCKSTLETGHQGYLYGIAYLATYIIRICTESICAIQSVYLVFGLDWCAPRAPSERAPIRWTPRAASKRYRSVFLPSYLTTTKGLAPMYVHGSYAPRVVRWLNVTRGRFRTPKSGSPGGL
jgi:hypothetical protein